MSLSAFAISIKFFSLVYYIVDAEAKNSDCSVKNLFCSPTGKKVKDPIKYFHLVAGTCPTANSSHGGTKHSLWDKFPELDHEFNPV